MARATVSSLNGEYEEGGGGAGDDGGQCLKDGVQVGLTMMTVGSVEKATQDTVQTVT